MIPNYKQPSFETSIFVDEYGLKLGRIVWATLILPIVVAKIFVKITLICLYQFKYSNILIIYTGFGQTIHDIPAFNYALTGEKLVVICGSRIRHNTYIKHLWTDIKIINIWLDVKDYSKKNNYIQTFGQLSPFKVHKIIKYLVKKIRKSSSVINQNPDLLNMLYSLNSQVFSQKASKQLEELYKFDTNASMSGKKLALHTTLNGFNEQFSENCEIVFSDKILKKFSKLDLVYGTCQKPILIFYARHRSENDNRNLKNIMDTAEFLITLTKKYRIVVVGDGQIYLKKFLNSQDFIFIYDEKYDSDLLYLYFVKASEVFVGTPGGGAWFPALFKKRVLIVNHRPISLVFPNCVYVPIVLRFSAQKTELKSDHWIKSLYAEDSCSEFEMFELTKEQLSLAFHKFERCEYTDVDYFFGSHVKHTGWGLLKSPKLITLDE